MELTPQMTLRDEGIAAHNADLKADYRPDQKPEGPGVWETAAATVLQEAPVVAGLYSYAIQGLEREASEIDVDFNPYTHFLDNEEQYADLREAYNQGKFDKARNQKQFDLMALRYRDELDRRSTMAEGSGLGVAIGAVGSMLDLSSFIPFVGQIGKVNKIQDAIAGTIKFGAAGGAFAVGSEALLHASQEFRTAEESMYAVAGGSLLVGALGGAVYAAKARNSVWNPTHPQNPLVTRQVHQETGIRPGVDIEDARAGAVEMPDSVGAARSEAYVHKIRGLDEQGKLRRWVSEKVGRFTPASRVMRAEVPEARVAGFDLMEHGEVTADMYAGAASRPMEAWKAHYIHKFRKVRVEAEGYATELNKKLASLQGKKASGPAMQYVKSTASRIGNYAKEAAGKQGNVRINPIERTELNEAMLKAHLNQVTPEYRQKLAEEFGSVDAADAIIDTATKMSNDLKDYFKGVEKDLLDKGLIKPEEALGDNYRMVQQWVAKGISRNLADAELFFMDVLKVNPAPEYLGSRWGIDQATFDKLGKEDVKAKTIVGPTSEDIGQLEKNADGLPLREEEFTVESGKLLKKRILDDWQGSKEEMDLEEATARYEKAVTEAHQIKNELAYILNESKKATTQVKKWKRKEMETAVHQLRKERDLKNAEKRRLTEQIAKVKRQLQLNQATTFGKNGTKKPKFDEEGQLVDLNVSSDVANLSGRLEELMTNLKRRTAESAQLADQVKRAETWLAKYQKRMDDAKAHKERVKTVKAYAENLRKEYNAEARKSGRALKRLEKKTPLVQAVDDIIESLTQSRPLPANVLDSIENPTTGRLKQRSIHLSDDQAMKAIDMGFLKGDLYDTTELAAESLAAELAIATKGYSRNMLDEIEEIRGKYDELKKQAKAEGRSAKDVASIEAEKHRIVADLEAMRDRMKGIYRLPEDPESLTNWAFDRAREMNYVRYGAGFLVSSLTDPASLVAHSLGGIKTVFTPKFYQAIRQANKGQGHAYSKRLSYILESAMHNSRVQQMYSTQSMADGLGIGALGTNKQKVTSFTERALKGMSETMGVVSGLMKWNQTLKMMSIMEMQHEIASSPSKYLKVLQGDGAGLSSKDAILREKLLSVGLDEPAMARIAKMIEKYPPEGDNVLELGMARWLEDGLDGQLAYNDMEMTLTSQANKAIFTPGIGDTPLFMSGSFGKVLLQFQTHSFTFLNRFMKPVGGRMLDHKSGEDAMTFGLLLSLGAAVVTLKDLQKDIPLDDRSQTQWVLDTLDRSGMLMYFSPYIGLFSQAVLGEQTSRYAGQRVGDQLAGPSFGLVKSLGEIGYKGLDPNQEVEWNLMKSILPYKPFFDLMTTFGTEQK